MKLRALQDTQIVAEKGLQYVKGPAITQEGAIEGDVVDVPDKFRVNPIVWEVVKELPRVPGQPASHVVLPNPVKGVRYTHKPWEEQPAGDDADDDDEAPKVAAGAGPAATASTGAAGATKPPAGGGK